MLAWIGGRAQGLANIQNPTSTMYVLTCQMKAPSPIEETFAVFENPDNLARITPEWLKFRVTTSGQVTIRKGAEIEYQIRLLGLPVSWKTRITAYEPPLLFEDEQAEGPYALWRHRHSFEEVDDGTVISDRVEYALPFGPWGDLRNSWSGASYAGSSPTGSAL